MPVTNLLPNAPNPQRLAADCLHTVFTSRTTSALPPPGPWHWVWLPNTRLRHTIAPQIYPRRFWLGLPSRPLHLGIRPGTVSKSPCPLPAASLNRPDGLDCPACSHRKTDIPVICMPREPSRPAKLRGSTRGWSHPSSGGPVDPGSHPAGGPLRPGLRRRSAPRTGRLRSRHGAIFADSSPVVPAEAEPAPAQVGGPRPP